MSLTKQELEKILSQKLKDPNLSIIHTAIHPISLGARNKLYRCKVRYQGTNNRGSDSFIVKVYEGQVTTKGKQSVSAVHLEGKILHVFNKINLIGIPRLYFLDYSKQIAVMEDMGSNSLAQALSQESLQGQITLYKYTMEILVRLHAEGSKRLHLLNFQPPSATRWFRIDFVFNQIKEDSYCQNLYNEKELKEFEQLVEEIGLVMKMVKINFLHGDLNPDNILVNTKGHPVFIDWELARLGHAPIDILDVFNRHPKEAMPALLKKQLLHYYLILFKKYYSFKFDVAICEVLFDVYNLITNFLTVAFRNQAILRLKSEATTIEQVHQAIRFEGQVFHALENLEECITTDSKVMKLYEYTTPYLHMLTKMAQKSEFKNINVKFGNDEE